MPSLFIRALAACAPLLLPIVARAGAPYFPSFPNGEGLVLNGSSQIVGDRLRLTEATTGQVGAAWWHEPVQLATGFTSEFRYSMHDGGGADGLALVIQTVGTGALGGGGGGIGVTDIGKGAFVAIRSYIYHQIVIGASETLMDPTAKNPLASANTNVRGAHLVRVAYSPPATTGPGSGVLTVSFDGAIQLAAAIDLTNFNGVNLLSGDGTAYIGLTAATGGETDIHDILAWSVNQPLPPPPPLEQAGAYSLRNGFGDPGGNMLCAIDPETATILGSRVVTMPGETVRQATGLARHPFTGQLYAVLRLEGTDGRPIRSLVTLDKATAEATLIGSLGEPFAGITFLPDGRLLGVTGEAASNPETIYEIDPETAATMRIAACASGETGETIVATPEGFVYRASGHGGSNDAHIERVDFSRAPELEDLLPSHAFPFGNQVSALAWSDLAGAMYLTTTDRGLYIVNRNNGEEIVFVGDTPFLKGLAFDGATLYGLEDGLGSPESVRLHTLSPETGASIGSVQVTLEGVTLARGHALARHPVSGVLYAIVEPFIAGDGGPSAYFYYLVTIDPATGAATLTADLADRFKGLAFLADGRLLGVTDEEAFDPENLYLIDASTGARTLVTTLGDGDEGKAIAVADGLLYIASGDEQGRHFFQRTDPLTLQTFTTDIPFVSAHSYGFGGEDEIYALGWSETHQAMFVSTSEYALRVVGIESPVEFDFISSLDNRVKGIAFAGATCYAITNTTPPRLITLDTKNGAELSSVNVVAGEDPVVQATGLARHPTTGELFAVVDTKFSTSTRLLATIDPATGAATILGGLSDYFAGIAFRADGSLIGVTGDGGNVRETLFLIAYPAVADGEIPITPLFALGNGDDGEAIAIAPNGLLYHASGISQGEQHYESVNLDTQVVSPIVVNALPSHSFPYGEALALAYSPSRDRMYVAGSDGALWEVDRSTGATEQVGYFLEEESRGGPAHDMKGFVFDEDLLPAYTIVRSVVANGGGVSVGEIVGDIPETFVVHGVIGQHDAHGATRSAPPRGGSFEIRGGFFPAPGPAAIAPNPCPGDTNADGVVDFIDLNNVLSAFGLALGQPGFLPGADLNGDGVVDFIDLNIVLSFFGTAC